MTFEQKLKTILGLSYDEPLYGSENKLHIEEIKEAVYKLIRYAKPTDKEGTFFTVAEKHAIDEYEKNLIKELEE